MKRQVIYATLFIDSLNTIDPLDTHKTVTPKNVKVVKLQLKRSKSNSNLNFFRKKKALSIIIVELMKKKQIT